MSKSDWECSNDLVRERSEHLLESGLLSDCSFIVGTKPDQQEFKAHKLFLAMSSPVFEAMFFGTMAEKGSVIIVDIQPDVFKALLLYIYADRIQITSFDQIYELCYTAKKYMLIGLINECIKYINYYLNPKNAGRTYEFAKLFEESTLMYKSLRIIHYNTREVLFGSNFDDLELNTILKIFDEAFLNVNSEMDLFSAISRYATRHNQSSVEEGSGKSKGPTIRDALKKIRFLTLSPQQFTEISANCNLLTDSEKLAILMNINSKESTPMPPGFSTLTTSRRIYVTDFEKIQMLSWFKNKSVSDWKCSNDLVRERSEHLSETGTWSDCSFIVGTEPDQQVFKAHTLILAMSSPVFEAMFFGTMAEKDSVIILDIQPEAFKALLIYIYADRIRITSFDQIYELCYAAKKYMLSDLVNECMAYISHDLTPKYACRTYEFAKLFEESTLMNKSLSIIRCKINEVLSESNFDNLELNTILKILDEDYLKSNSEMELFSAISQYAVRHNLSSVEEDSSKSKGPTIRDALKKIRFLTLSPQQFTEISANCNFLTDSEKLAILMNINSKESTPMPPGFSTSTSERC